MTKREKRSATLLSMIALLTASASGSETPRFQTEETRAIAAGFMHMQYDLADLAGAKTRYYSLDFIQHNSDIPNGQHGDQAFIDARAKRDPGHYLPVDKWVNKIDHVLVDGKLFAIHHHVYTNPHDRGRVFLDIWRTENGKMVEHWDVIQSVPEEAKNDNTMWSDLAAGAPPKPGEPKPEAVIRDYLRMGLEQGDPIGAAERYCSENLMQHSPHIADGKAALIAYFKAKAATPATPTRLNSVSHILADGDLVLVTRHTWTPPDINHGFMYADLFRVRSGKIVEHWDVIQAIPETSVNGNTMW